MGKYTNKDHIYKRRLLVLADFLDKLPRERFNYETWVGRNWGGKQDLSCGTTGCALGWAATIPSLRKAGLKLFRPTNNFEIVGYVGLKEGDPWEEPELASGEVFGLDGSEHEYLFMPASPPPIDYSKGYNYATGNCNTLHNLTDRGPDEQATPKQVAKHIRRFVKAKYGSL